MTFLDDTEMKQFVSVILFGKHHTIKEYKNAPFKFQATKNSLINEKQPSTA